MTELLTPDEVAAHYGVGRRSVLRWIASGKLPAIRTPGGRDYRIPASALETGDE